jgi:hypothetical protein
VLIARVGGGRRADLRKARAAMPFRLRDPGGHAVQAHRLPSDLDLQAGAWRLHADHGRIYVERSVPTLLTDFPTEQQSPICADGSSRLIGTRAVPPKRRQRKSTPATAIRAGIGVNRRREIITGEFRSA